MIPQLKRHVPLRRMGTESEVSAAICFLLSPGASFITGVTLAIDGGAPLDTPLVPDRDHQRSAPFDGFHRSVRAGRPEGGSRRAGDDFPARYRFGGLRRQRRAHGRKAWPKVRALEQKVRDESASKRDRFEKRGQLLPRERVARLLDRGSDFIEFATLAGLGMHDDDGDKNGAGRRLDHRHRHGRRQALRDHGQRQRDQGRHHPADGPEEGLRAQEIARDNRLPLIYLVESGGANLIYQSEMFIEGGRSFANQARLSAAGIPQIAIVHGASTAGGAYLPGSPTM
jgi:hypothetical protein